MLTKDRGQREEEGQEEEEEEEEEKKEEDKQCVYHKERRLRRGKTARSCSTSVTLNVAIGCCLFYNFQLNFSNEEAQEEENTA